MTVALTVAITAEDARGLDDAMAVMRDAFDPSYGEAWTASQCAGVLSMPGADLLIARGPAGPDGVDAPVGFALLRTVAGDAELMLIAVAPAARRQGVARQLLEHGMTRAAERGATKIFLEVRADNPAQSTYRAAGMLPVGRRRDYYRGCDGRLRDALTFARDL